MTASYVEGSAGASTAAFTNTSGAFILLLQFDVASALTTDGDSVTVTSGGGKVIGSTNLVKFGTAASEDQLQPYRFLIPPNGKLTGSHSFFWSGVKGSLEDLRGYI